MANSVHQELIESLKFCLPDLSTNPDVDCTKPLDSLSFVYMYLVKMRLSDFHPIMALLKEYLQDNMANMSLTSLSYFSVAVARRNPFESRFEDAMAERRNNLSSNILLAEMMPHLKEHLNRIDPNIEDSMKDFRKCAIVLTSGSSVISHSISDLFLGKLRVMLEKDLFRKSEGGLKVVCKILYLSLTMGKNSRIQVQLLLQLKGKIHKLRMSQLKMVSKVIMYSDGEPASIFYELNEFVQNLYHEKDFERNPRIALLSILVQVGIHKVEAEDIISAIRTAMESDFFWSQISDIVYVLRASGFKNDELTSKFFQKAFHEIKNDPLDLKHLCKRYLNFVGSSYADRVFERLMIEKIDQVIEDNPYLSSFCSQMSFLLACSKNFDRKILSKFYRNVDNISKFLILIILEIHNTVLKRTTYSDL